ncbi:hypothetical protein ACJEDT_18195 [Rhodococcoides fascians]|uniref:hypothetical protein n=1 Tax=Rhodococcoides fascians TaxID=1828 RepID=UPI00389A2798
MPGMEKPSGKKEQKMAKDVIVEVTDRVERMDALEDRLGISLEGLYAIHVKGYRNHVKVNFDVISPSGKVDNSLKVIISIYNSKSQQIGTTYAHIDDDDFVGIESCSETIDCDDIPTKIRVYPTGY